MTTGTASALSKRSVENLTPAENTTLKTRKPRDWGYAVQKKETSGGLVGGGHVTFWDFTASGKGVEDCKKWVKENATAGEYRCVIITDTFSVEVKEVKQRTVTEVK